MNPDADSLTDRLADTATEAVAGVVDRFAEAAAAAGEAFIDTLFTVSVIL